MKSLNLSPPLFHFITALAAGDGVGLLSVKYSGLSEDDVGGMKLTEPKLKCVRCDIKFQGKESEDGQNLLKRKWVEV